jgi:hypothetical protein
VTSTPRIDSGASLTVTSIDVRDSARGGTALGSSRSREHATTSTIHSAFTN